jgi:Tfp pilus assembly ATPase PilU
MPSNPLDNLCDAIRALSPTEAQQALSELYQARIISLRDAMACARAIMTLRVMVDTRDAKKRRLPSS